MLRGYLGGGFKRRRAGGKRASALENVGCLKRSTSWEAAAAGARELRGVGAAPTCEPCSLKEKKAAARFQSSPGAGKERVCGSRSVGRLVGFAGRGGRVARLGKLAAL